MKVLNIELSYFIAVQLFYTLSLNKVMKVQNIIRHDKIILLSIYNKIFVNSNYRSTQARERNKKRILLEQRIAEIFSRSRNLFDYDV